MHYRLIVEYDGTDFHGWQVQPDQRTVQATLETVLQRVLGEPLRIAAAGRTDAGVHAAGQVVCFRSQRDMAPSALQRAVNALTPDDLVVLAVDQVSDDFNPRRDARSRRYEYRIWNRRQRSPFWRRYAWHIPWALDLDVMQTAAAELVGEHDFSSFRAAGCDAAHAVRRVLRSEVERDDDMVVYTIEATAFLRHMVRNIVGSLVETGQKRRSADFGSLLAARDRTRAAETAPPQGLCLVEIRY